LDAPEEQDSMKITGMVLASGSVWPLRLHRTDKHV